MTLSRTTIACLVFVTPLFALVLISFTIHSLAQEEITDPGCIRTFQAFAYTVPQRIPSEFEVMTPPASWEAETSSNTLYRNNNSVALYQTALARTANNEPEIWVSLVSGGRSPFVYYISQSYEGREGFAIYHPQSGEWEIIPDTIGDSGLYVVNLFADSSGTVWGHTRWDWFTDYPELETVPVLSRFNENTRHFEFAEGVLEIPLVEDSNYFNYTKIVPDAQDIFWIVTDGGDIYRYDPITLTTDLAGHVPGGIVTYAALSPDGSIYFMALDQSTLELRLREHPLFQFFPETGNITLIDYPHDVQSWAPSNGLLVDRAGQLWLGAIGYRDVEGDWHLIYPPYMNTYNDNLGQYLYAAPQIMFESSDGRLWYQKYLDTGGWGEGTAWYDPATQAGCMFTNQFTNVVEDDEQQVWIVVDGVLYRYPLNP